METFKFILFEILYCVAIVPIVIAHHVAFEMPELSVEDATSIAFSVIIVGIAYIFAVRFVEMRFEVSK